MKKFLTIAVLAVTLTALSGCSWITDKINSEVQSTVDDINTGISDVTKEIGDELGGEKTDEVVPTEDAAAPAADEATTPAGE